MQGQVLTRDDWQAQASDYYRFASEWTVPFRERRRIGGSHPVHDFLFVYYQYSPAKFEKWHPGCGTELESEDLAGFDDSRYSVCNGRLFCDPRKITGRESEQMRWIVELLKRTAQRPGNFSCLGMHEWAMVYQGQEIRHESSTELRLEQQEVDKLVESRPITCSHFDAFRFFADEARPLNRFQPTMETRPDLEQPACIHANMDLYKWAFKTMPWVGSKLLRSCFELAMRARHVDMRASPYDLGRFEDCRPIKIETAEGRLEYEREQREIAAAAAPLRLELCSAIDTILEAYARA